MITKQVIKYFTSHLLKRWKIFVLSFVLSIGLALMVLAKAWIVKPATEFLLNGDGRANDLVLLAVSVMALYMLASIFGYFYTVVSKKASSQIVRDIRQMLFERVTQKNLSYFIENHSAQIMSKIVNDITSFEMTSIGAVQNLILGILKVTFLLGYMIYIDWRLTIWSLILLASVALILKLFGRRVATMTRKTQNELSNVNVRIREILGGMDVVLGFGLQKNLTDQFKQTNTKYQRLTVKQTQTGQVLSALVTTIVGVGIGSIIYVAGTWMLSGEITVGEFASYLVAIYLLQDPIMTLTSAITQMLGGFTALSRAMTILNDDHELPLQVNKPVPINHDALSIAFENVSFTYAVGPVILSNINFSVNPGSLVLILGDSGSGKSTMAKLLLRFYDPDSGQIKIGNVPLQKVILRELYQTVSYVPQDTFLFNNSIEHNIRIANPSVSDQELQNVLKLTCIDRYVYDLQDGLNTIVGEKGAILSGGQRQRVAIARSLIKDPQIIIFDEATSALDMELETSIINNIVKECEQKTIFAITHRLGIAEHADYVIYMKNGSIAEQGTPGQLLKSDGYFSHLYREYKGRRIA